MTGLFCLGQNMSSLDYEINSFSQSIKSLDSTELNFFHAGQFHNSMEGTELTFDSSRRNNLLSSMKGEVMIGYEYGLLTGYIDPNSFDPLNVFNSRGSLSVEALSLPIDISYNYSSMKNPLGVNNYFRVSLDTDRLKERAASRKNETLKEIDNSIEQLSNKQSALKGRLGMGEVLKNKLQREIDLQERELLKYESDLKDSISSTKTNFKNPSKDSLNKSNIDSLNIKYERVKSNFDRAVALYDTVSKLYKKALGVYESYTSFQTSLEQKKQEVSGLRGLYDLESTKSKADGKKESFISSIETFDLGLTYPNTSALSNNSLPVQGLNFEMQRNKWYAAISAGVTMNNLMVTTDVINNKLTNTQNLFNQFDFQNVREKGLLTSVKTGYGTPEGQHYFVGFRYLTNSPSVFGSTDSLRVPSFAGEIDIRLVPKWVKGMKLDLVYGKTSNRASIVDSVRANAFSSVFSKDRTNTGLVRVSQSISKVRTNVQASLRWLDPLADTRSLGVLQPNNVRYEVRTNTRLPHNIRVGLNYRQDRNNVANWSDTTIQLNVIGGQINGQINKVLNYFGSLNYLVQETRFAESDSRKENYMFGVGVSSTYNINNIKNAITISYNDYLISDTTSTGLYRNISVQNMSKLTFGTNTLSLNYFKMDDPQFPLNTAYVIGDEISVQNKRFVVTLGVKMLHSEEYGNDFGGKLEGEYRFTKQLSWLVRGEKLVLGDFYNYYSRERFERFPYTITTRITYTFN